MVPLNAPKICFPSFDFRIFRKNIWILCFGSFRKVIAFSVSAVASGWFFGVFRSVFSSEAVRRGPGRPKLMSDIYFIYVSKKGRLPTFCSPQNCKRHPFYIFGYNLLYLCTKGTFANYGFDFWPKAGKRSPQPKMLANVPPQTNIWRGL